MSIIRSCIVHDARIVTNNCDKGSNPSLNLHKITALRREQVQALIIVLSEVPLGDHRPQSTISVWHSAPTELPPF